jgi:toxin ParE1/3/4
VKRHVEVKPEAVHDLLHFFFYIKRDSPSAAERLIHAFDETIFRLSETPGMGGKREYDKKSLQGLRSYPIRGFPNHLVFYKHTDRHLEVIRVIHAARDLEKALESHPG